MLQLFDVPRQQVKVVPVGAQVEPDPALQHA